MSFVFVLQVKDAWRHAPRRASAACAFVAVAFAVGAASARAEIVYMKGASGGYGAGAELIAMNDDGSGAHVLLAPSQVPPNDRLGFPELLPGGSTLAFQGITDENDNLSGTTGDSGANYGGLYTMSGGVVRRLTDPPAPAAMAGSEDTSPSLTADGRILYQHVANSYNSFGYVTGSSNALLVRPLSGGPPAAWPTNPPASSGLASADPVSGSQIAYTTDSIPDELVIGSAAGTGTVVASQQEGLNPSWSPDGSQIVDVDHSASDAGIWVFAASANATGHQVLVDPSASVNDPVFAGPNEIVFDATISGATNIYAVPTSCNACSLSDPAVRQLTSDGTSSAPDFYPAWTSQTLTQFGQTGGSGGGTGQRPGRPTDQIARLGLASSSVRSGQALTLEVTLKAPATIKIQILRLVPASGHGKHRRKAHYALVLTLTFKGHRGLNKHKVSRAHGRALPVGRYVAKVSAGANMHLIKFSVRR
jgi:hypothetical protein